MTAKDAGFSLIEVLVASALSLVVLGTALALANPAGHVANAQPDAVDMEQRLRAGAAALTRDLQNAGAGIDDGPTVGALNGFLPPILPRRIGASGGQSPETTSPEVISLVWVPATRAQAAITTPFTGAALTVEQHAGCPSVPACGFSTGMGVLVFDSLGQFDLFTATMVVDQSVQVRRRGSSPVQSYDAGAVAAELEARTYYFDRAARQLRIYDADLTDSPVLDGVTQFSVEYFGSPSPPMSPKPPPDQSNCLYDDAGHRLGGGQTLASGSEGLARLPLSLLADGPWCGAGDLRFDADLLRIRRVRVTLGVQASALAHQTSRVAWRRLADRVITFDVSPRNLGLVAAP